MTTINDFELGGLTVTVLNAGDIRLHDEGRVYATVTLEELESAGRRARHIVEVQNLRQDLKAVRDLLAKEALEGSL